MAYPQIAADANHNKYETSTTPRHNDIERLKDTHISFYNNILKNKVHFLVESNSR